jgi:hypothetical protein
MIVIRYRWKRGGAHVHVRVFIAYDRGAVGVGAGELTFREEEWHDFVLGMHTDETFLITEFIED